MASSSFRPVMLGRGEALTDSLGGGDAGGGGGGGGVQADVHSSALTFRHHASYIKDRRIATPQSTLFIYLVNKYI